MILKHICNIIHYWFKSNHKYKLNDNEKKLWCSIISKANVGYKEWFEHTHGDDLCGPWIKDCTEEEEELIEKIHEYFYGEDWYVVMPLSYAQINYVMYYDIKDKLKY